MCEWLSHPLPIRLTSAVYATVERRPERPNLSCCRRATYEAGKNRTQPPALAFCIQSGELPHMKKRGPSFDESPLLGARPLQEEALVTNFCIYRTIDVPTS